MGESPTRVDQSGHARIWSPRFVAMFAINFVITFAQFMSLALLPKLAQSLGASAITVGIVTGIFAVTAISVRPVVGLATLRLRHSALLVATIALIVVAFLLYAFSTDIALLIVARLLHGAGMGFLAPVTLAMAGDALPSRRIAQGIGIFSLAQAVTTAVGPVVGLWLLSQFGYRVSFLIGAGLLAMAAVLALRVRSPAPSETSAQPFGWRSFIAIEAIVPAVMMFLIGGAFSGVNSFVVLYGESLGVDQIGLFFTAYAAFILISRPIAGRLADRYGLGVVIIPGMIMFGVSFVLISQVTDLIGFLVAGAVSALGYGICQPAIQTLSLTSVPAERRGVASNTGYLGLDLGYLVMPMLAGWIVTSRVQSGVPLASAYSMMYVALTVPIALGLLVFVIFGRGAVRARWRPGTGSSDPHPPTRPKGTTP